MQDVRAIRGADVNSDHLMILAKVRIKLANNANIETKRIKYNVDKIKNLIDKDIFQLELRNRFDALYWEDQELDIESESTAGRDIIKNTCEEVLGKKTNNKKE